TQPNAALAAQNLIALGATAVIFMPIGFATENHETLLDVEHIIGGLRRKHPDINYVQMPCVNDHSDFLRMAADWADEHIAALISEQARPVNLDQLAAAQAKANHSHGHSHGHDHGHQHGHRQPKIDSSNLS
ncbi:MAG: ferrochelatase, partial [Pseudanabaenales cyanobacterium]|nr:ferrochelatase [Pseudanabaenales cyanobacterium]